MPFAYERARFYDAQAELGLFRVMEVSRGRPVVRILAFLDHSSSGLRATKKKKRRTLVGWLAYGAKPIHLIITMIKWIWTSRLSKKNSLWLALFWAVLSGGKGVTRSRP